MESREIENSAAEKERLRLIEQDLQRWVTTTCEQQKLHQKRRHLTTACLDFEARRNDNNITSKLEKSSATHIEKQRKLKLVTKEDDLERKHEVRRQVSDIVFAQLSTKRNMEKDKNKQKRIQANIVNECRAIKIWMNRILDLHEVLEKSDLTEESYETFKNFRLHIEKRSEELQNLVVNT